MAFSLSEFRSSINNSGIARTNSYEVRIGLTSSLINFAGLDSGYTRELTLRCQSVQLPEVDLLTVPYYSKVIGGGERRVVGLNQYKVIGMEFIVDGDMKVQDFFNSWLQYIVNTYSPPGANYNAINGNQLPYEVGYRDEYSTTIDIDVYPRGLKNQNTTVYSYKLHRAFPVNSGNITLSYSDNDKYMILPIGFTYDSIETPKMNRGLNLTDISQGPLPPV